MTSIDTKVPLYIKGLPYKTSVRLQHLQKKRREERRKQE